MLIGKQNQSATTSTNTMTRMAVASSKMMLVMMIMLAITAMQQVSGYGSFYDDESAGLPGSFLAIQNQARAEVGVPPLQWSPQLAKYAQWWANQNAAYGDCLLHHSGGPYGENIFWGSGRDWSPIDAVSDWANEKRWYDYNANSCEYYDACGHYTQIVWRTSRYVGCARVTCSDGKIFMTCNYYPPGNYIGQRPY